MLYRLRSNPLAGFALALILVLAAAFSGCAQFGQNAPKTPEDTLRYGQAVLTGAYKTVGDAAGTSLSAADARSYFNRMDAPKKDLDAADKVVKSLPNGAALPADTLGKINAAVAVLNIIADELRARLPAAQTAALPAKR